MADKHEQPPRAHRAPARVVPPPFAGPPRTGPLAPRSRGDRLTLPPFSPPLARTTPQTAPPASPSHSGPPAAPPPPPAPARHSRVEEAAWPAAEPNEQPRAPMAAADVGAEWRNPDAPTGPAPTQAATGIAWLDSPEPQPEPATASDRDADDPFGWDPAEERGTALDAPRTPSSLDALKEIEPWALPGAEAPTTGGDVAAALERVAVRIRSGELLVPGAAAASSDEALLAAVLAALLQRARG